MAEGTGRPAGHVKDFHPERRLLSKTVLLSVEFLRASLLAARSMDSGTGAKVNGLPKRTALSSG